MTTSRHIKVPEPGPSSFREDVTLPSPCEEILSFQIREIGADRAGRIAKLLDQILGLDAPFGLHQQQSLMFIGFHLTRGLGFDGGTVGRGNQRIDDLHRNADRPAQLHIRQFAFENAPSDRGFLESQSVRNLCDGEQLLASYGHGLSGLLGLGYS